MDWDDLRVVLAIGRDGTLLRAAERLGVAHTTVGRRLKALETTLGVRLFDRTPDGFLPTPAGDELLSVAERVEGEVLSVEGRVLGQDAQLQGKLRISTVDTLFHRFDDVFTAFMARYPSIELTISATTEAVSLTRREADVVLRLSAAPSEHLVGRRLGYVQFGIYASAELVDRVGEGAPLEAFPWIGWDGARHQRWFEGWLAQNAPGAKIAVRLENSAMVTAHAIRAGLGVQILPCFLADPDSALRRVAPLDALFRLDLWVLTLAELRGNSRVRVFMDHVAAAFRGYESALTGVDEA